MTQPSEPRWTWRKRLQDPRFPAFVLLVTAGALFGAAALGYDLGAVLFTISLAAGVGLVFIAPWRDTRHRPITGAAVLGGAALLVLVAAWVVHVVFGSAAARR